MKRKVFGGALIIALVVSLTLTGIFFSGNNPKTLESYTLEGFQYLFGGNDRETGAIELGGRNTELSMRAQRDRLGGTQYVYDEDGKVVLDENTELPIEVPGRELDTANADDIMSAYRFSNGFCMPVFPNQDMQQIVAGVDYNTDINYGFIMIDPRGQGGATDTKESISVELRAAENVGSLKGEERTTWWRYNRGAWGATIQATGVGENDLRNSAVSNKNTLYYTTAMLTGAFDREGFYEFYVNCSYMAGNTRVSVNLSFSFYIVHASEYEGLNRPLLKWKEKNSAEENPYGWGSGGRYYYNLNGYDNKNYNEPFMKYKESRFQARVAATDERSIPMSKYIDERGTMAGIEYIDTEGTAHSGLSEWSFKKLGSYSIEANIVYWDAAYPGGGKLITSYKESNGKVIDKHYSTLKYSLSVFGAQAYYENYEMTDTSNKQLIFDGKTYKTDLGDNGNIGPVISANITTNSRIDDLIKSGLIIKPGQTQPLQDVDKFELTAKQVEYLVDSPNPLHFITPAVTNAPPVRLFGNVVSKGHVYYKAPGSTTWKEVKDSNGNWLYDKDGSWSTEGEWFIALNFKNEPAAKAYKFKSGDVFAPVPEYFQQFFYFKINNFVDARIVYPNPNDADHPHIIYFNEFVRSVGISSAFVAFLQNGNGPEYIPGPYEMQPRVQLSHYYWHIVTEKELDKNGYYQKLDNDNQKIYSKHNGKRLNVGDVVMEDDDMMGGWLDVDPYTGRITLKAGGEAINFKETGVYIFRVYYGNLYLSKYDFAVVIDGININGLDYVSYDTQTVKGDTVQVEGDKGTIGHPGFNRKGIFVDSGELIEFEIFGNQGPVSVRWGNKPSDPDENDGLRELISMYGSIDGVGKYSQATVTHYPFSRDNNYFGAPDLDEGIEGGDFSIDVTQQKLRSPYKLEISNPPIYNYKVGKKPVPGGQLKWTILNREGTDTLKFEEGGLYIIHIWDTAGGRKDIGFLIDTTLAAFSQNSGGIIETTSSIGVAGDHYLPKYGAFDDCQLPKNVKWERPDFSNQAAPNVVDKTVWVGFGSQKIIKADGLMAAFENLRILNLEFVNYILDPGNGIVNTDGDIVIEIVKREWSKDDSDPTKFQTLGNASSGGTPGVDGQVYVGTDQRKDDNSDTGSTRESGYRMALTDEGFYFLKSTDAVGNVSMWYVWVNYDKSLGMVLQDSIRLDGKLNDSTTLIMPEGMANQDNIYFSFLPVSKEYMGLHNGAGVEGHKYIVDRVECTFYPFDLRPDRAKTDKNYPFSSPDTNPTSPTILWQRDGAKKLSDASIGKSESAYYDSINNGSYDTVLVPVNQTKPETEEGLYKITRYYDMYYHESTDPMCGPSAPREDKQVRNYYFVVDRNQVIPSLGRPFESEIELSFKPNSGNNPRNANYKDFYTPVPTNAQEVKVNLPSNGTKYGGRPYFYLDILDGWSGVMTPFGHTGQPNPGLTPAVQQSKYLNTLDVTLSAKNYSTDEKGDIVESAQDIPLPANNTFTQSGKYRVYVRDKSSFGISWQPYGRTTEDSDAKSNKSKIDFRIDRDEIMAFWRIKRGTNDAKDFKVSDFGGEHWTQLREGDSLMLYYKNDTEDFFSPLSDPQFTVRTRTRGSYNIFASSPVKDKNQPEVFGTVSTTYLDLMKHSNSTSNFAKDVADDQIVDITAKISSPATGPRDYVLRVDNEKPVHTLTRVKAVDKIFNQGNANQWESPGSAVFDNFIFSIPDNFAFTPRPDSTKPYGARDVSETDKITYQRVDESLNPIGAWMPFDYELDPRIGAPATPFSEYVKLSLFPDKILFFCIKETDRAGNETIFYVRLRNEGYRNVIPAKGTVGPFDKASRTEINLVGGEEKTPPAWSQKTWSNLANDYIPHIFANDITMGTITQLNDGFFAKNANFSFSYTVGPRMENETTFARYKYGTSTWKPKRSNTPSDVIDGTVGEFHEFLRIMLEKSVDTVVNITYKDGFGTKYYKVSQLLQETNPPPKHTIKVSQTGVDNRDLLIEIENFTKLYDLYDMGNRYRLELFGIDENGEWKQHSCLSATPVLQENKFYDRALSFNKNSIKLPNYLQQYAGWQGDYVIVVTDSFGRAVTTEYHGSDLTPEIRIEGITLAQYKNTPACVLGVPYVGSSAGVTVTWNESVLDLTVLKDNKVIDFQELYSYSTGIDSTGKMAQLVITPEDNYLDTSSFQIIFHYKIIGRDVGAAYVYEWRFYTLLPVLTFKNVNGNTLTDEISILNKDENGNIIVPSINGIIELTIDTSAMIDYFSGNNNITYTREYTDDLGEKQPLETKGIRSTQTRYTFDKVGVYKVTVKSRAGAERIFNFIIKEVDNLDFKLFYTDDDGNTRQLLASPEMYEYDKAYPTLMNATGGISWIVIGELPRDNDGVSPGSPGVPDFISRRNIPVYWVNTAWDTDLKLETKETLASPDGNLVLVPSMNTNRGLIWVSYGDNHTNTSGISNATASWNIYYLFSKDTGSRLYFAIASTDVTPSLNHQMNQLTPDSSNLYRLYRSIDGDAITVSIPSDKKGMVGPGLSNTNVYYIDYYQNNIYGGRIFQGETLRIQEHDIGEIRLEMNDWAGNRQIFTDTVSGRTEDNFKIYNFAKPPLLIASKNPNATGEDDAEIKETIVDEMVYNDFIELSTTPGPRDDAVGFYIYSIKVTRDGVEEWDIPRQEKKPELAAVKRFTTPGRYTIECEYNAGIDATRPGSGPSRSTIVKSTHIVQLVDSGTSSFVSAFTFSGASNIRVVQVRYGSSRVDISREFGITAATPAVKSMSLTRKNGNGLYRITFEIDATNVRESYRVTRDVYLLSLEPSDTIVGLANGKAFGATHKGSVTVKFTPQDVVWAANNGRANVTISQNGKAIANFDINGQGILRNGQLLTKKDAESEEEVAIGLDEVIPSTFTNGGQYQIVVTAANGTVVFADGFSIQGGMNPAMVYISIGIVVVFMAGAVVFIRLRAKLRVK
ncbi:MAG: hypothetical protein LBG88_02245 [Christensenellaceae bacterium]|jgi:hypothetical protein|nr:hypothetical protein [Christensenellaceae bacterium]